MARSAKDSFELAYRVLHDEEGGQKTSHNKRVAGSSEHSRLGAGSGERSRLARQESNRARASSDAHSDKLQTSQKSASDAAENLATGRKRQRKRDAAKSKHTATKKRPT